jgi:hypothetical protein
MMRLAVEIELANVVTRNEPDRSLHHPCYADHGAVRLDADSITGAAENASSSVQRRAGLKKQIVGVQQQDQRGLPLLKAQR